MSCASDSSPEIEVIYERAEDFYYGRKGVEENNTRAAELFEQAANQGHGDAQFKLGLLLSRGRGMVKDEARAAYFLEMASHQGHIHASFNLALLLEKGLGVVKNETRAAKLFEQIRVAYENDVLSQIYLAMCGR